MVKDRLAEPDAKAGFLLDGFPRTIAQAEQLRSPWPTSVRSCDGVLELVVDEDELVRRLSGRRDARRRPDGAARRRQARDRAAPAQVYREQTAPLSGFYDPEGLLARIDAIGEVEEVTARALDALGAEDAGPTSSD